MESELLQLIVIFVVGLVCGALIMLLWNKLSSGSASPAGLKQEYQDYQDKVEAHFEETSKKFQDMTEQYQDLYKHLSVGATSLCRPDSVAATLADESQPQVKLENKEANTVVEATESDQAAEEPSTAEQGKEVSEAPLEEAAKENGPEDGATDSEKADAKS